MHTNQIITVLTCLLWTIGVYAQTAVHVPVSPEASALIKQTEYPVDLNRGLINIGIPLLEISSGDLRLPIGLQYHAGGFRKGERPTRSGLGWSLNSDLQITRVVNDKDDFGPFGYLQNTLIKGGVGPSYSYQRNNHYLNGNLYAIYFDQRDGEPDKYSFSLLGKSGTFIAQKNENGVGYEFVTIPYDNIKISFDDGAFKIVDSDGTIYFFGRKHSEVGVLYDTDGSRLDHLIEMTGSQTTAWKCYKIFSSKGFNELTFQYENKSREYLVYTEDEVVEYKNETGVPGVTGTWVTGNHITDQYWHQVLLTSAYKIGDLAKPLIHEKYGAVGDVNVFRIPFVNASGNLEFKRVEDQGQSNRSVTYVYGLSLKKIVGREGFVQFFGSDRLEAIEYRNPDNSLRNKVQLFQSMVGDATVSPQVNYLDSLHFFTEPALKERYSLVYYDKFWFGVHLKGCDMWGFVNDYTFDVRFNSQNTSTIPYQTLPIQRFGGTMISKSYEIGRKDQYSDNHSVYKHQYHPSKQGLLKGMLRNIIYPTGGLVEFDYEPHQYREEYNNGYVSQSVAVEAGGLRIRTVNYSDLIDNKLIRQENFRYGKNEDGSGEALIRPVRSSAYREMHFVGVKSDPVYHSYYKRWPLSTPL